MITISERACEKLPGFSSIFVNFNYNAEVIDVLKKCEVYYYHKKDCTWELPITDLAFIIEELAYLDDLDINILPTPKSVSKGLKTTLEYKLKPYPYQMDGILYGINHNKWLLLDDMGLGKTMQIIHIAEELKAQKGIEHCVIICGINALKSNWESEIHKHSDLGCRVIGKKVSKKGRISYTTLKERTEEIKHKIEEFFIVTNIETLRSDEFVDAFLNSENKFDMIVEDEAHKTKDASSLQGKNFLKLTNATYQIAATGTLLLNGALDAYVPLKWLGVEHCSNTMYKSYFCTFHPKIRGMITGFKHMDILKDQIAECSLRRTKQEVLKDLPPKTYIEEYIDMTDEHKKFYEDVKEGIRDEVDKVKLNRTSLLARITRLRQVTSCPQVLTSNAKITSNKIDRCIDLIQNIVAQGDKVVVMSNFKESINLLDKLLKDIPHVVCIGDTPEGKIECNKDKFQNDDNCKVMLCTWQKMGTGHTLTAANYMIHLDTAWTWGLYEQTCDRIYRIGAKKPVFIYNLICKDTIDEVVYQIINRKKNISDTVIDNDTLDDDMVNLILSNIKE